MYEKSYGYLYGEQKGLSLAEIAKRMRQDIKQAKTEGLLPLKWKYSVRTDTYSGGGSICINVQECADAWISQDDTKCTHDIYCNDERHYKGCPAAKHLTDEAEAAGITLKRIHGAYNHDGSDAMTDHFDVNYYGSVGFDDSWVAESRVAEKARLDAKKTAREAGKIIGKVANMGAKTTSVHYLIETPEGKKVLACGGYIRRYNARMVANADEIAVTCSRCAKRGVQ